MKMLSLVRCGQHADALAMKVARAHPLGTLAR